MNSVNELMGILSSILELIGKSSPHLTLVIVYLCHIGLIIGLSWSRSFLLINGLIGSLSLLSAFTYVLLQANDVAMTEMCVNTGLSSIFFVFMFKSFSAQEEVINADAERSRNMKPITALLCIVPLAWLSYTVEEDLLRSSGRIFQRTGDLSNFYIKHSPSLGCKNVVSATLAGFRGFDTLIETCVIFVALVGVAYILQSREDIVQSREDIVQSGEDIDASEVVISVDEGKSK